MKCIGLVHGDGEGSPKVVKLFKVGYHIRLLDLDRSDPFGSSSEIKMDDDVPEGQHD